MQGTPWLNIDSWPETIDVMEKYSPDAFVAGEALRHTRRKF